MIQKIKTMLLLASVILLSALGLANGETATVMDGTPIAVIQKTGDIGQDRIASIYASIDGHSLTVSFLSDIGQVTVKVLDENNLTLDLLTTPTPTGYLYYIPNAGRYTVVFTFADGDEYYGEFEVTN